MPLTLNEIIDIRHDIYNCLESYIHQEIDGSNLDSIILKITKILKNYQEEEESEEELIPLREYFDRD